MNGMNKWLEHMLHLSRSNIIRSPDQILDVQSLGTFS